MLLVVLSPACAREPEPPEPAERPEAAAEPVAPYCRNSAEVQLEPEVAIDPDPGMGPADIAWQGDLDGDGSHDLLLRFPDACGNYGDCPYAIYVACPDAAAGETRFASVWEPAYSFDLAVDDKAPPSSSGWLTLVDTQRSGSEVSRRRLGFDGRRYAITEVLE